MFRDITGMSHCPPSPSIHFRYTRCLEAWSIVNVSAERIPDSQVVLTITIDTSRVEHAMERAYKKNVGKYRIPGFRPGKTPRRIFEQHVGRTWLLTEALEDLVPAVVNEEIKNQGLDSVAQPDLAIEAIEPEVVVKATVPVRPTVRLNNYRDIRVEEPVPDFDPAKTDEAIEDLRDRYAVVEPVEREVQEGDRVRLSVRGRVEDENLINQEDVDLSVRAEVFENVPGVYDQLLGMVAGDEFEWDYELPDDFKPERFAGKTIRYNLAVHDVKAVQRPELNDEFAQQVGEHFPTMAALRERLEQNQKERGERESRQVFEANAIQALIEGATMEYPPQMVEHELSHVLSELLGENAAGDRRAMERFLSAVGRTEEELRDQFRPTAITRIQRSLALDRLTEVEQIEVSDAEFEEELTALSQSAENPDEIIERFRSAELRPVIERQVKLRKTQERLLAIAKGEAPSPASGDGTDIEPEAFTPAAATTETTAEEETAEAASAAENQ